MMFICNVTVCNTCRRQTLIPQIINFAFSDYVPCPYCNRRFNAKAGARHITFCQQRTKTYGEPIKSLSKRAAADVGGSKTGRGKAVSI